MMAPTPTSLIQAFNWLTSAIISPPLHLCTCPLSPFLPNYIFWHSSRYRYKVEDDGTFSNRKLFAYVSPGIPDGVHCDTKGNVYSGVGDGVQVWNPSGTLLGKIYLGRFVANFRFAGKGRMVLAAQTELFYVTLAAEGADPESEFWELLLRWQDEGVWIDSTT